MSEQAKEYTGNKTDVTALVKYAQSLEADIERLRAALKDIVSHADANGMRDWKVFKAARKALEPNAHRR